MSLVYLIFGIAIFGLLFALSRRGLIKGGDYTNECHFILLCSSSARP